MISFLPRGVKLERRKKHLVKLLEAALADVTDMKLYLLESIEVAVSLAEVEMYSWRGKRGEIKKEIVFTYIMSKCPSLDRDVVGRLIDTVAQRVPGVSIYSRLKRFLWSFLPAK